MPRDGFPAGVSEQLKWYVYRLIDPRNGETFYVGKGKDDRVFSHARGQLTDEEGEISDPKLRRVKEIRAVGLEVSHIIHRHGLDERAAYQVEAALIDAYPGLTNKVRGQGARDYGSRHVEEIINEYAGEEFKVKEPLLLISIGVYYYLRDDPYDAVRYAWKLDRRRRESCKLVLASLRGVIVGAYRPTKWLPATRENFRDLADGDMEGYVGFVGGDAETEVWDYYVGKRVPGRYRKPGSRNPRRYCYPDDASPAI